MFLSESALQKIKKIAPYAIGGLTGAGLGMALTDPEVQQAISNTVDDLQYQAGKFFAHHPQAAFDYLPNSLLYDPDFIKGAASEFLPSEDQIEGAKEFLANVYQGVKDFTADAYNYLTTPDNQSHIIQDPYAAGLTADQVNQIVDPNPKLDTNVNVSASAAGLTADQVNQMVDPNPKNNKV